MKKLLRISLLLILLLGVAFIFLLWNAGQFLTPEVLATSLEENINSRVQIEEVEVSLLSTPTRIVLKGVELGVRDEEVEKPYHTRTALQGAPVQVGEIRLAVNLWPLFRRGLEVREMRLREPQVSMILFEDGGNSLDELFRSPGEEGKEDERVTHEDDDEPQSKKKKSETLNVSQLEILSAVEGVALEDGLVTVVVEKTNLSLRVEDLNIALHRLEIDPANPDSFPVPLVDLDGVLFIESSDSDRARYGRIGFSGFARAELFDLTSGDLEVAAELDLQLDEESYLGTNIPVVEKAWDKLGKLEKVGVDIGKLPEKATFGQSHSLALHYAKERGTLTQPISLVMDGWELALDEGTWIQTEQETHAAQAALIAEEELSAKLHEKMVRTVKKLPKELRPEMVAGLEDAWFREGRLHARIVSEGRLSKPSLDVANKTPDLEEIAKDAAKRFVSEQLEELFGRKKK